MSCDIIQCHVGTLSNKECKWRKRQEAKHYQIFMSLTGTSIWWLLAGRYLVKSRSWGPVSLKGVKGLLWICGASSAKGIGGWGTCRSLWRWRRRQQIKVHQLTQITKKLVLNSVRLWVSESSVVHINTDLATNAVYSTVQSTDKAYLCLWDWDRGINRWEVKRR